MSAPRLAAEDQRRINADRGGISRAKEDVSVMHLFQRLSGLTSMYETKAATDACAPLLTQYADSF
jgi:hypothetical protein